MILAVVVLAFIAGGDVRPRGHRVASMRRNLALRIILERNLNRELLAIWRAACPPDAVITRLEAEHLTLVAEAHRVAREIDIPCMGPSFDKFFGRA